MVVIKAKRLLRRATRKLGLISTLALPLSSVQAQQASELVIPDSIKKTEIALLYSHYLQDGDHSAVTGGTGTEELTVYATNIQLKRLGRNDREWQLKGGADFITSASTDNINFRISSASREDVRAYLEVDYSQPLAAKKEFRFSIGSGLSVESDYLSVPLRLGLAHTSADRMRSIVFQTQYFYDDLRWGRFDEDYYRPALLVYPQELRGTEWHTDFLRRSYNFKLGYTQVINKRLILGLFPAFIHQNGLLATPFHRVYFTDGSLKVEKLPTHRNKFLLGLKANVFVGGMLILKNSIDWYQDDFGIQGLAIDQETAIKLTPFWTLSPFARVYFQQASDYFAAFEQHHPEAEFYTSDYDLSGFNSFKGGIAFRFAPGLYKRRISYEDFSIRYAYYRRSDGLYAHILSFAMNGAFYGKKKRKK